MFRFGKFLSAQWRDIKGNAKWWTILLVFSAAAAIYKHFKPAGVFVIMAILFAYFAGVAIIVYFWYRDWCKRQSKEANEEHNKAMNKIQQDWLKNGKNRKFKGPI
jgi:hypothetical protein